MTPEEYDEIKADMLQEERESNARDLDHEERMTNDFDYILEHYSDTIQECYYKLQAVCIRMNDYGWEETPESLIRNI